MKMSKGERERAKPHIEIIGPKKRPIVSMDTVDQR